MLRTQENHNESKVIYLDTCLPDYFQGFGGNTYAIPIDGNTTYQELKDSLLSEIDSQELFYQSTERGVPESVYLALKDSVPDLFSNVKSMESIVDSELNTDSESESVYMYFGVVIKTKEQGVE